MNFIKREKYKIIHSNKLNKYTIKLNISVINHNLHFQFPQILQ